MKDSLANTEHHAYSYPHIMQQKLKTVPYDLYSHRDLDQETEKIRIIETAAKLMKDDIKAVKTSHSCYPCLDEVEPEHCINFLLQLYFHIYC